MSFDFVVVREDTNHGMWHMNFFEDNLHGLM
jgi:hypothetical protein